MAEQLPNKVCLDQCEPDAYSAFSRSLAHAGYAELHKGLVNMYNPEILRKVVPKAVESLLSMPLSCLKTTTRESQAGKMPPKPAQN